MKKQGIRFLVDRLSVSLLAIAVLLFLSGCSSSVSRIQTWEGSAANAEQVALLSASGAINVKEVNGQPMTGFMFDDLSLDYELLPGENQIVFTYKTIWSKAERVEDGESKVYVVETPRQTVTLNAEPGNTYEFDIDKPDTRQQAEAQVEDFSVTVVNASGQAVASSSPWVAADSRQAVSRAPVPETRANTAPADASTATTLEQLKALWGDASENEKRAFLSWAFE